jgi:hypothetical protein
MPGRFVPPVVAKVICNLDTESTLSQPECCRVFRVSYPHALKAPQPQRPHSRPQGPPSPRGREYRKPRACHAGASALRKWLTLLLWAKSGNLAYSLAGQVAHLAASTVATVPSMSARCSAEDSCLPIADIRTRAPIKGAEPVATRYHNPRIRFQRKGRWTQYLLERPQR